MRTGLESESFSGSISMLTGVDAFQKLARKEMHQIPVVQNGKLIGMTRRRDILR